LDTALERARTAGLTVIGQPSRGADGLDIAFLHPRDTHGVLIELCALAPDAMPEPRMLGTSAGHVAAYRWPSQAGGVPVVLLHGSAGTAELETQHLARLLQPAGPVWALDLPGHGRSDAHDALPAGVLTAGVREALGQVAELDEQSGKVDVFGFSLGGALALDAAGHLGDTVRRVAVHATSLDWPTERVDAMLARLDPDAIRSASPAGWDALDRAHRGDAERVLRSLVSFVEGLRAPQPFADVAALPHPLLVTTGDSDALFGLDPSLDLYHRAPHSRLGVIPGAGHRLGAAESERLAPMLLDFFAR
jgi:pimeloyl-ACP methyl ester carboxylesterase